MITQYEQGSFLILRLHLSLLLNKNTGKYTPHEEIKK